MALITGAGGQHRRDLVRRYLEEGAHVVMVGRNRKKLDDTLAAIQKQIGRTAGERASSVPFDGADPGQARLGIEKVIEKYGQHRHAGQQRRLGRPEAAAAARCR